MGKNYVENSLKRFLKRKVKITLGVVVTFLITGAVSFATENDAEAVNKFKEDLKNQNTKIEEIETNLQGLGSSHFKDLEKYNYKIENGSSNREVTVSYDESTGINKIENLNNALGTIEIKDSLLTEKTKTAILNALEGGKYSVSPSTQVNNNILLAKNLNIIGDRLAQSGKDITNNGILGSIQNVTGGTGINNGLIYVKLTNNFPGAQQYGNLGIVGSSSVDVTLINNGLIIAKEKVDGQYFYGKKDIKGTLINNGTISSEQYGQHFRKDGKGNLYNYGVIEADEGGQYSEGDTTSYNYGVIDVSEETTKNKAGVGQSGRILYNYGLIKVTDGLAMNGTNHNYGVIKSSGNSIIFGLSGTTESNGIVISKNADNLLSKDWAKDTAIFSWGDNNSYTLKNGVELKDKVTNESFGENKIGAVVDGKADIEGVIKDKNIASIISGNTGKTTVFTSKGNELVLENTNITGYFENKEGGTVLDVTASDLTLSGKVNITAVKDQQTTTGDVVAVELGADKTLTLVGSDVKINGKVNGLDSSTVKAYNFQSEIDVDGNLKFSNITDPDLKGYLKENNFTKATIKSGSEINNLTFEFSNTAENKVNTIHIEDGAVIKEGGSFTDNTAEKNDVEVTIDNLETFAQNLDGITFGAGNNTVIVKNAEKVYDKTIDLGTGEDTFIVKGLEGEDVINRFNHHIVNAETVELQGGTWGNWTDAKGTIKFEGNKAGNKPTLRLGNDTIMHITLNAEKDHGSDFADYVANDLKLSHAVITGTGNKSVAKYQIDETNGLDTEKLSTTKYSFGEGVSYKDSPIFNISSEEGTGVNISLKTAADLGLSGQQRVIYDAYIKQIIADGSVNKGVIDKINNMNNQNDMVNLIKETDINGRAYYTAGSVVTKDIVNSYVSSVEEFKPRAEKGQWLAQGKYINSDTEFDGGSKVKGYDGDITGTVGMIEYGFTDNTSYGAVFGQGDAEMDINGGGKLDGDNIYAGLYMKHRTANGIELVGNIGYVKSDMDSDLRNDFTAKGEGVSIGGSTTEKGTADSSAVILSLKGRKDYKITDTVKVQPIFGARATFINQEKAENPEMNFTVAEQDIIVLEGTAGMGIAKEFALPQGILELNAGAEYTFAATSSNNDAEYTLFEGDYQATHIKMDDVDAAENTGTVFVGADYEHENGVGFNAKYEMMWSDKGDDSRVTAGISYRF